MTVVTGGKLEWDLMRNQLDQVNRMSMHDLLQIVRRAKDLEREQARIYLTEALSALVNTFGGAAAEMTASAPRKRG